RAGADQRERMPGRRLASAHRTTMGHAAGPPPVRVVAVGHGGFALLQAFADHGVVGLFEEEVLLETWMHFVSATEVSGRATAGRGNAGAERHPGHLAGLGVLAKQLVQRTGEIPAGPVIRERLVDVP